MVRNINNFIITILINICFFDILFHFLFSINLRAEFERDMPLSTVETEKYSKLKSKVKTITSKQIRLI